MSKLYPYHSAPDWAQAVTAQRAIPGLWVACSAAAIFASGANPAVAVVAGLSSVVVGLASMWWRHRAALYFVTPFGSYEDWQDARGMVIRARGVRGLEPLTDDLWTALSGASVAPDRWKARSTWGEVTDEWRGLYEAAMANPGRAADIRRAIVLFRDVRAELEERDSSS